MKTTSLTSLLARAAGEYRAKRSMFDIPETLFREMFELEAESPGLAVMSGRASIPVGPAAGPHTQLAGNILAAYFAGARVFELKTVQQNDRLDIDKPCIDALDEGHNVEWSTELTLEEARREYLNAWIAVNLFGYLMSRKPTDFFFNMSVGYTLDGIKSAKVDAFIEGMRRPEATGYWSQALGELEAFVASPAFSGAFGEAAAEKARTLATHMPVRPVHSVTLSTMHGCPPAEIEKIGRYLIEEKGFNAYIKLNPTLIGYDEARTILDRLGWDEIALKRESFEHDLQFGNALALIASLDGAAQAKGRKFGIKLSNTLANANNGTALPGAERYMSGRALFPITVRLAAKLAEALPEPGMSLSYCGGVSALNAADLVAAGLGPLTVATDILKPGGYLRLAQIAREAVGALPMPLLTGGSDTAALRALADAALERPEYRKGWKAGTVAIARKLPLFDCFAAPCVEACPVNQKVPSYIAKLGDAKLGAAGQGAGGAESALAVILSDNPLAHITGVLCDHVCQERCSRLDYEGSVRIRDAKLTAARAASLPASPLPVPGAAADAAQTAARPKTAVIGAGPAGLACAWHLALAGHAVKVFEAGSDPGGVPANVIPRFRIGREEIAADIERIKALGVEFAFKSPVKSLETLREQGFTSFFVGIGADSAKDLPLAGSGVEVVDALAFLGRAGAEGPEAFAGKKRVVVAGGGNTACDAVRAATRIPGVETVCLSYRRTRREMPADLEELENAEAEALALGAPKAVYELSLPEEAKSGAITLRKMALGERDASGRRSPEPTAETFELPCDLLIAAIGEAPDRATLEKFGIAFGADRKPIADAATMATSVPGVYLGGDARRGPASIIAAEADGRAAARAIVAAAGGEFPQADYKAPRIDYAKLARRGEIIKPLAFGEPGFAEREAERCLACDSACLRCVEVCPNRANTFVEAGGPFAQQAQILHLDRLCNECGNCGFFCPYEGEPYSGKITLFDGAEDMAASRNAGFAFIGKGSTPALLARAEIGGPALELDYASWNGAASLPRLERVVALARAVFSGHRYLLEATP